MRKNFNPDKILRIVLPGDLDSDENFGFLFKTSIATYTVVNCRLNNEIVDNAASYYSFAFLSTLHGKLLFAEIQIPPLLGLMVV